MQPRVMPAIVLCTLIVAAGCTPSLPNPTAPTVLKVSVSQPIVREVADYEDFTGRTEAASTVDLRARVTGYLVKVHFKDGDIVGAGDPLYEIDPRPFEEQLAQAKGQVERLQAMEKYLAIEVVRYTTLVKTQAATQEDLDKTLAQQAENIGSLKAAEAQVRQAALNLGFTKIAAPISGKISRTLVTPGNLVTADTTLLTTIASIDPMYAYFNIEEPTVLRIQKLIREGVIPTRKLHEVEVRMGLADDTERTFPLRGKLDFVDNTVDPLTGTILVRGTFANPHQPDVTPPALMPGLFVRVRLHLGPPHQAPLITERAIGTDQGQKFVYVVDAANKANYRPVKLGLVFDGLQAIEEGLTVEDRVVVNGLQRVRPGAEVQPEQVEMASSSKRP